MARCVISPVLNTDEGGWPLLPACVVHTAMAPCRHGGEPACPTLLMFGEEDPYITPAEIEMVRDRHPATVVYPGAGHGFMRDGSNSYNQAASVDAWSRMLRFFTEQLL